jgi:hypothetical protein
MNRTALVLLMATLALAAVCVGLVRHEEARALKLPPVVKVTTTQFQLLRNHDRSLVPIVGSGSMQPFIPASADPAEIVALAQIDRCAFALLGPGELIVFRSRYGFIIHRLAQLDGDGWITDGTHNQFYDAGRVTPDTYVGRAVKIYTL